MIAASTDPLAPFMHALLFRAVPVIILCGVAGAVLGALKGEAEKALTALVLRFVRGFARHELHSRPTANQPMDPSIAAADNPHCPRCNALMIARQGKRGERAGERFWGCSTYPTCRGTRLISVKCSL